MININDILTTIHSQPLTEDGERWLEYFHDRKQRVYYSNFNDTNQTTWDTPSISPRVIALLQNDIQSEHVSIHNMLSYSKLSEYKQYTFAYGLYILIKLEHEYSVNADMLLQCVSNNRDIIDAMTQYVQNIYAPILEAEQEVVLQEHEAILSNDNDMENQQDNNTTNQQDNNTTSVASSTKRPRSAGKMVLGTLKSAFKLKQPFNPPKRYYDNTKGGEKEERPSSALERVMSKIGVRKRAKSTTKPTLVQIPDPPHHNSEEFESFWKDYLYYQLMEWLYENDQLNCSSIGDTHSGLLAAQLKKIQHKDSTATDRFNVISGEYLLDDTATGDRFTQYEIKVWQNTRNKPVEDISVTEGLILFRINESYYKNGSYHNLNHHPYPFGRKNKPTWVRTAGDNDESELKAKLKAIYKHKHVIICLMIQHFIQLARDGKLRASTAKRGLKVNGPHWTSDSTSGYLYINGSGKIIGVIRLAGLVDSVLCGYHDKIIDEQYTFTRRNGTVVRCGIDTLYKYIHGAHLLCFVDEKLNCGISANHCFSFGHVASVDKEVNNWEHFYCNGGNVAVTSLGNGVERRILSSTCNCHEHGGNFGRRVCQFTMISNLEDGIITETIKEGEVTLDQRKAERTSLTNRRTVVQSDIVNDPNYVTPTPKVQSNHHLQDTTLSMVDLETNGGDPKTADPIEFGAVKVVSEGTVSEVYRALCDPGDSQLCAQSYEVHKLTKEMLHGTQGSALRYLEWVESIGSNNNKHCIIGHNIKQFDIPIIIRSLVRGVSDDIGKARIDRFTKAITHYIDTYPLFRDCKAMWDASPCDYPQDTTIFQSFKLGDLYSHVFSERLPNAHTAVGDAKANLKLLLALDPTLYYAKGYMKEVNELVAKITQ